MAYRRITKKVEEPDFIEVKKFFLVRTGPSAKIQIPGIVGLIKRGKRYEVTQELADGFRGAAGYRIIEEMVRIPNK